MIAQKYPNLRIRFSTSNPQDMKEDVFHMIAKYDNICKYVHLPVQSGSSSVLKRMNRQHTREEYMNLIDRAKQIVPEIAFSQDMIVGFCGETEQEHQETLSLMEYVGYDYGYMFAYSERPGTPAAKKMPDDIPEETKKRRLQEVIDLQRELSHRRMKYYVGKTYEVLIEGNSKKNENQWYGRTSQNAVVVFPKTDLTKVGDFVKVLIKDCTSGTLIGIVE